MRNPGARGSTDPAVDCMASDGAEQDATALPGPYDVALLRAISLFRPIGEHKHFHMVSILHALEGAPGAQAEGSGPSVWARLQDYYDLQGLEEMEEGSDDDEEPVWLRTYEDHLQFLRSHEKARTRVLQGADEEEFALHPLYLYEPIIRPRRAETNDTDSLPVVPPSQEDEEADSTAADVEAESESDREGPAPRSAHRRAVRKRGHTEEDHPPESLKDDLAHNSTRASKRRRGSKVDDDASDTLSRAMTTRRQQKQLDDDEKKRETEDGSDAATDGAGAGATRSARSTPARRATSTSRNVRASPSPAPTTRSTRTRRS